MKISVVQKLKALVAKFTSLVKAGCRKYILPLLDSEAALEAALDAQQPQVSIPECPAFTSGRQLLDWLYQYSIDTKDFNLGEVAHGIAWDDDTGRLCGEMSLQLRKPSVVKQLVTLLLNQNIRCIDDVYQITKKNYKLFI